MSETETQIEVQNSAIIAGFTPLIAIYPMTFVNIGRNLSSPAKYWVDGVLLVFFLILFVWAIRIGMKKVPLALRADGVLVLKNHVPLEQIERMIYNKRTRFLNIKARSAWHSFSVYLGKKEEVLDKVTVVESWAQQMGIRFETKG